MVYMVKKLRVSASSFLVYKIFEYKHSSNTFRVEYLSYDGVFYAA